MFIIRSIKQEGANSLRTVEATDLPVIESGIT